MTFHLSGKITIPVEDLARARAALQEHVRLTRAEPGCRAFAVTEQDGGVFEVSESFDDRAAFEAHQARLKGSAWAAATINAVRDYKTWTET